MELYVVMSNMPGPGAKHLVAEKARDLKARGYVLGMVDELAEAADGACEFVELETDDGKGVGTDLSVEWGEYPVDPEKVSRSIYDRGRLHRLGPFVPASAVEKLRADAEVLAREIRRIDALGGPGATDPGPEGWPSTEAVSVSDRVLERRRSARSQARSASSRRRAADF